MNFYNFFSIYVFEVKLFIAGISTQLPCSGDFEYSGQPSVHELLFTGDLETLYKRKLFWIFEGSIDLSANDSLTLKTYILKILQKSMKPLRTS